MVRGATGLAATWILSCLPLVLPSFSPELALSLGDASRLALAALPWIAWLGAPGRRPGTDERRGPGPLATAALAAPPLAAGTSLDLSRGGDPGTLAAFGLAALAMISLLAFAAHLAARTPGRARLYAVLWLAIVPGAPLLRLVLALGGAPNSGEPPRWLSGIAGASPLGWIGSSAVPSGDGHQAFAGLPAALGACLVLLAVAGLRAAPTGAAPEIRT